MLTNTSKPQRCALKTRSVYTMNVHKHMNSNSERKENMKILLNNINSMKHGTYVKIQAQL